MSVFFNLFSEAEPFALILTHGTHAFWGDSWGPKGQNSRPQGSLGRVQRAQSPPAMVYGKCCKVPQRGSGHSPDRKYILDLVRAQRTLLVAANVGRSLIFYWAPAVPRNPWIPLAEFLGSVEPQLKNTAVCFQNDHTFHCTVGNEHVSFLMSLIAHSWQLRNIASRVFHW